MVNFFLIAMSILVLFNTAMAEENILKGVRMDGAPISEETKFYIVHGGCRENSQNESNTEIWLFLASRPNVNFDPNSKEQVQANFYLNEKVDSFTALLTCSFLRYSREQQSPVEMELHVSPKDKRFILVKSMERSQLAEHVISSKFTTETKLLQNFWDKR